MKTPPRREFLHYVLAACGTPLVARVSARAAQTPQAEPRLDTSAQAAGVYFGEGAEAARVIGEAHLRQLHVEPTRASILEHAGDALEILRTVKSEEAVFTALVSAVRRDFQEGRLLELDGWILSRTEVQLCTLMLLPAVN
jgi:hypothetical protein